MRPAVDFWLAVKVDEWFDIDLLDEDDPFEFDSRRLSIIGERCPSAPSIQARS